MLMWIRQGPHLLLTLYACVPCFCLLCVPLLVSTSEHGFVSVSSRCCFLCGCLEEEGEKESRRWMKREKKDVPNNSPTPHLSPCISPMSTHSR